MGSPSQYCIDCFATKTFGFCNDQPCLYCHNNQCCPHGYGYGEKCIFLQIEQKISKGNEIQQRLLSLAKLRIDMYISIHKQHPGVSIYFVNAICICQSIYDRAIVTSNST